MIEKTEEDLKALKADYRVLMEHSPVVMMILDPKTGEIVDANRAAETFYGYSKSDLLGITIGDINVLGPEAAKNKMAQAVKQEINHFEFVHRLCSGELRHVRVVAGPVVMGGRELLYTIIEDVTEEKRREWLQLADFTIPYICLHSRSIYEMLDSIVNFIIESTDIIGCRCYAEFSGHGLEAYDRTFIRQFYQWRDPEEEQQFRNRQFGESQGLSGYRIAPVHLICGDGILEKGNVITLVFEEWPVRAVLRIVVTQSSTGATEKTIRECSGLQNVVVGGIRRIIQQNLSSHAIVRYRRALEMVGVERWECVIPTGFDQISDQELAEICSRITRTSGNNWDETARTLADRVRQAERRKAPYFQMEQFFDGQWVIHNGCIDPPSDLDPEWHLVGVTMPIGELKELQLQLEGKVYELEKLTQTKDRFLSSISHELKTPMNGVWGMTQLLEASGLTEEQQEYLRTLKYSNHRLMRVIENLLCYSGLDMTPRGGTRWEPVLIEKEIYQIYENQQLMNIVQDPKVEIVLDQSLYQPVDVDGVSLRILLDQLLDTAFQKGKNSSVYVEGFPEAEGIRLNMSAEFEDTTEIDGLYPLDLESVFPRSFSASDTGPSLGYEIVKTVLDRSGMVLSVTRKEQNIQASLFIPVRNLKERVPEPVKSRGKVKALIVDDDETSRLMMGILCKKAGIPCESVETGYAGLERYRGDDFGLVLMDIQMPGMNGEDLLLALKQVDEEQGIHSVKIAVTAYSLSGNEERYLGMGFDYCLTKPLDYQTFQRTLGCALEDGLDKSEDNIS